jgi:DNA repair protein RecO (recombination protein O)
VGRGALAPVYAGYYVAELLDALTDDYDPHPDLYAIADRTLAMLSSRRPPVVVRGETVPPSELLVAPPVVSRLVFRFELVTLRILGHLPSLDVCVECVRARRRRRVVCTVPSGPAECGLDQRRRDRMHGNVGQRRN